MKGDSEGKRGNFEKEGKRGKMGHSAGMQRENKGLLEHSFLQSVRLISRGEKVQEQGT